MSSTFTELPGWKINAKISQLPLVLIDNRPYRSLFSWIVWHICRFKVFQFKANAKGNIYCSYTTITPLSGLNSSSSGSCNSSLVHSQSLGLSLSHSDSGISQPSLRKSTRPLDRHPPLNKPCQESNCLKSGNRFLNLFYCLSSRIFLLSKQHLLSQGQLSPAPVLAGCAALQNCHCVLWKLIQHQYRLLNSGKNRLARPHNLPRNKMVETQIPWSKYSPSVCVLHDLRDEVKTAFNTSWSMCIKTIQI